MCVYLGSSVKPQSGKKRTFQFRRYVRGESEAWAERRAQGGIGRTNSRQVLSRTGRVLIKTSNLFRLLIILVSTPFLSEWFLLLVNRKLQARLKPAQSLPWKRAASLWLALPGRRRNGKGKEAKRERRLGREGRTRYKNFLFKFLIDEATISNLLEAESFKQLKARLTSFLNLWIYKYL